MILILVIAVTHFQIRKALWTQSIGNSVTIVLSPHFDDAVLSLGGLLAKEKGHSVVATFFTGAVGDTTAEESGTGAAIALTEWDKISGFSNSAEATPSRTEENKAAVTDLGSSAINYGHFDTEYGKRTVSEDGILIRTIAGEIETLIKTFSEYPVFVYGPAEFGDIITHPDHKTLHRAFVQVSKKYAGDTRVHFFIYEDYPYVARFRAGTTTPLAEFLEKSNGVTLEESALALTRSDLVKKGLALSRYTSQIRAFSILREHLVPDTLRFNSLRCRHTLSTLPACEVVYKIW